MKSPVFTLMFALAALVPLPGTLSASESYRFFTQNDAKLASSRTPVFYLSGSVFNDTNNNRSSIPGTGRVLPPVSRSSTSSTASGSK